MRISEKQMKSIMKEFKYVITDPEGIHARPAGEFTGFAQSIHSFLKCSFSERKNLYQKN